MIKYWYKLGVSPKFKIKVACGLQFHFYLRTSSLEFQKATEVSSKIEVVQSLPCLAVVVLKYPRNCRFYTTLMIKVSFKILYKQI